MAWNVAFTIYSPHVFFGPKIRHVKYRKDLGKNKREQFRCFYPQCQFLSLLLKVKLNVTIMIKIYRIKKIPLKSIFHSVFIVNYRIGECHDMSSIAGYLIKAKIYISTFKIPALFLPNI